MSKDRALLCLKRKDQETGLHYNRYRYYLPYVGRFVSKDPVGLFGGVNFYQYAHNLLEWVDPLGLKQRSLDEIKADRRRRENYKSGMYLKHTQAKCKDTAIKYSSYGKPAQYWSDSLGCSATTPQVTAFRNRIEKEGLSKGIEYENDGKGSHYYIYDAGRVIGYNEGKPTQYMRIEVSSSTNEFHGHPVSEARYNGYYRKRIK